MYSWTSFDTRLVLTVLCVITWPMLAAGQGPRISLKCSSSRMKIIIPKVLLPGFSRDDLHLRSPDCGANESPSHFTLVTKLTECGTVAKQTGNILRYSNVVLDRVVQSNPLIARPHLLRIPFRCGFFRKTTVSVTKPKPRKNDTIIPQIRGKGRLGLSFELFSNSNFRKSFKPNDFPVVVSVNKELYFEAKLGVDDPQLSIKAKHCFATPTRPEDGNMKYELIQNGCAVDDTVTFYKTLSSREQRFSLKAFKFTGMYPKVFFHCRVTVCNTSDSTAECARDCSTKSRDRTRRSAGGPVYRLAKGPIIFTPGIVSLAITRNDDPFSPYMFPAVVVTVAIVTVLLLVSLVSLARRLVKRRSCIEETADSVSTTALSVTKSCPSNIKSHSVQDTPVAVQIYFKQFQNSASS